MIVGRVFGKTTTSEFEFIVDRPIKKFEYIQIMHRDSGYVLSKPDLPVAVLIGNQTMSSGEAVTISFMRNKQARLFGTPTQGLSTVNVSHKLSDGALIVLTEGIFADHTGKRFGSKIEPDFLVNDNEQVIKKAVEWILSKP